MNPVTITELNNRIKSLVDTHFEIVYVKGEVSRVTYHTSGHLYFTLKDENSSINCAMWRNSVLKMKFKIKPGDKVLIFGGVSVYVPRGEYKLIAQDIRPDGIGELQIALERLKEELRELGYFDNKKPLPKFPKRIALITSKTGAALQDIKRVAFKRWRLSRFYIFDTLVQGDGAKESIAENIKKADEFRFEDGKGFDLIIVARGGGSREDLWAFNERVVADAIFNAKTPIISAVGHEIDTPLSDFVADKRAATPSSAIEIALPDMEEFLFRIDEMINSFNFSMESVLHKKHLLLLEISRLFKRGVLNNRLEGKSDEIKNLKLFFNTSLKGAVSKKEGEVKLLLKEFETLSPYNRLNSLKKETEFLKKSFERSIEQIFNFKYNNIKRVLSSFEVLNPKKRVKEGFVEVVKEGKRVLLKDVEVGDEVLLEDLDNIVKVKVLDKKEMG